jgi:hypothetical protein
VYEEKMKRMTGTYKNLSQGKSKAQALLSDTHQLGKMAVDI